MAGAQRAALERAPRDLCVLDAVAVRVLQDVERVRGAAGHGADAAAAARDQTRLRVRRVVAVRVALEALVDRLRRHDRLLRKRVAAVHLHFHFQSLAAARLNQFKLHNFSLFASISITRCLCGSIYFSAITMIRKIGSTFRWKRAKRRVHSHLIRRASFLVSIIDSMARFPSHCLTSAH